MDESIREAEGSSMKESMKESMILHAHAKVNLSLEILGKRADGFHDLDMVMQSIDLYDKIEIGRDDRGFLSFDCSVDFGSHEHNIGYQAAQKYFAEIGMLPSGYISIQKMIPSGAGLAGGSADAAAILYGLNRLHRNPLTDAALVQIAEGLGSDVPFCLRGGTMRAQGRGEQLTSLPFYDASMLIIKPQQSVSTKDAFALLDVKDYSSEGRTQSLVNELMRGNLRPYAHMVNNMYPKSVQIAPQMEQIMKELRSSSFCAHALMTGSGSTIFAIYDSEEEMAGAYRYYKERYPHVFKVRTVPKAIAVCEGR